MRRITMLERAREIRQRLLLLVDATPGLTPAQLGRRMGLPHASVTYHLRCLARDGQIRLHRSGRHLAVVLSARSVTEDGLRAVSLAHDAAAAAALTAIRREPGLCYADLARRLGVSQTAARFQVRKLLKFGAVVVRGRPTRARLEATAGSEALAGEKGIGAPAEVLQLIEEAGRGAR